MLDKIFITPEDVIDVELAGGIKAKLKPLTAEDTWNIPLIAKVGQGLSEGKEISEKEKERFFKFIVDHVIEIEGQKIDLNSLKKLKLGVLLSLLNEIMKLMTLDSVEESFPGR